MRPNNTVMLRQCANIRHKDTKRKLVLRETK